MTDRKGLEDYTKKDNTTSSVGKAKSFFSNLAVSGKEKYNHYKEERNKPENIAKRKANREKAIALAKKGYNAIGGTSKSKSKSKRKSGSRKKNHNNYSYKSTSRKAKTTYRKKTSKRKAKSGLEGFGF